MDILLKLQSASLEIKDALIFVSYKCILSTSNIRTHYQFLPIESPLLKYTDSDKGLGSSSPLIRRVTCHRANGQRDPQDVSYRFDDGNSEIRFGVGV